MKKIDAHIITLEEYEDLPELTDEFFETADMYQGEKRVRRGRPKAENHKVLLSEYGTVLKLSTISAP